MKGKERIKTRFCRLKTKNIIMRKLGNWFGNTITLILTLVFALYFYGFSVLLSRIIKEEDISDKDFATYSIILLMNLVFISFTIKFILILF